MQLHKTNINSGMKKKSKKKKRKSSLSYRPKLQRQVKQKNRSPAKKKKKKGGCRFVCSNWKTIKLLHFQPYFSEATVPSNSTLICTNLLFNSPGKLPQCLQTLALIWSCIFMQFELKYDSRHMMPICIIHNWTVENDAKVMLKIRSEKRPWSIPSNRVEPMNPRLPTSNVLQNKTLKTSIPALLKIDTRES